MRMRVCMNVYLCVWVRVLYQLIYGCDVKDSDVYRQQGSKDLFITQNY